MFLILQDHFMAPTYSPRLRKGSPRPDISCHLQEFRPCTSRCTFEVKRGLIPKDSVTPLTLHHVSLVRSNTPAQNIQSSRRPPQILTRCSSLELGAHLCAHSRSIAGTLICRQSLSPVSPPLSRRQGA